MRSLTFCAPCLRDWRAKLRLHLLLSLWMIACYFPTQYLRLHPPISFTPDAPFWPSWSIIYQSVFLLHTAAIWLTLDLTRARRYCLELAVCFGIAGVIFWIMPTHVARPGSDSWIYHWLVRQLDGPHNAFPSLHATMGLLAVLHLKPMFHKWRGLLWLWLLFLLASTLVTHQHVWMDLPAGLALGWAVHAFHSPYRS